MTPPKQFLPFPPINGGCWGAITYQKHVAEWCRGVPGLAVLKAPVQTMILEQAKGQLMGKIRQKSCTEKR